MVTQMTNGAIKKNEKSAPISASQIMQDLGFFWWIFGVVVGTPSVVTLYQTVFVDQKLGKIFQDIIDGYNQFLQIIGNLIEPWIVPFIEWILQPFNLNVEVYPHWRSVFILSMIPVFSFSRVMSKETGMFAGILVSVWAALYFLVSSIIGGAIPIGAGFIWQVIICFLPLVGVVFWILPLVDAKERWVSLVFLLLFFLLAMLFTGVASALNGVAGSGLFGLGLLVVSLAVVAVYFGDLTWKRVGLTILGGFIGAIFVYVADFVLKITT